jgi:hypothetical protein
MFEGWLYPILASYLGHYVKGLQKEQARSAPGSQRRTHARDVLGRHRCVFSAARSADAPPLPPCHAPRAAARGAVERRGAAGERGLAA